MMFKFHVLLPAFCTLVCSSFCHVSQADHEVRSEGQHSYNCQPSDLENSNNCIKRTIKTNIWTNATRLKRANEVLIGNKCDLPFGADRNIALYSDRKIRLNITKILKAPALSKVEVACKPQYALPSGETVQKSICDLDDGWTPRLVLPCLRTCPTLRPENVALTCSYGNEQKTCDTKLVSGTKVYPQCKPFHTKGNFPDNYLALRCQPNGQWDNILFKCTPDCGFRDQLTPFVYEGNETSIEASPWHVAIYRVSGGYSLICGGTIISPRMIISAAHCFFDNKLGESRNASNFEVVVGKYTRDYKKNDGFQKEYKILELRVHEKFNPVKAGHYGFDIAALIPEKEIELTKYVRPVCVDWGAKTAFHPGDNALGELVGWGIINATNELGTLSQTLRGAKLPFVSYSSCLGQLQPLPHDQFCAGGDEGPGARQGDSGGGLIFYNPTNKRYFLRGIVSTGKRWLRGISSFTDLAYHLPWLDEIRSAIDSIVKSKNPLASQTGTVSRNKCPSNTCGKNANCVLLNGKATCNCLPGYKGNPLESCQRVECEDDSRCKQSEKCADYKCIDVCENQCGSNSRCEGVNHASVCSCQQGFTGDPQVSCKRIKPVAEENEEELVAMFFTAKSPVS